MGDGFADVVRRHMERRGMSVRATARAAGYADHSLLSKVLNGRKPATPYLAACLDRVLDAGGEIRAAVPPPAPAAGKPRAAGKQRVPSGAVQAMQAVMAG